MILLKIGLGYLEEKKSLGTIGSISLVKNKNKLPFFKEFVNENECIVSNQLNELLLEFDISKCKF